jgi:tRNA(Ile)-lysidine synthase
MLGPAKDQGEPDRAATVEAAFTSERIASLLRPFEGARGILLAVSGGPDSIALMLLAAAWARGRAAPPPVRVATVDHGLRKDSRREAEQVAVWAAALGLPHAILVWEGAKQKSRIQELARRARYGLLFDHAAAVGADIVATAHHADDQAETILFRLARGSGLAGLSGMAGACERAGILHSRPLLGCAKAELVALCDASAHPYFDDPSNGDPAYARTRLRKLGGVLAELGFDREALLRLGRRAERAEIALAEQALAVRAALAARREPGSFFADISSLAGQPEEILLRILAFEIKELGDRDQILRLERLEAMTIALRHALQAGASFTATLGGAAIRLGAAGDLTLRRESTRRRGLTPSQNPSGGEGGKDRRHRAVQGLPLGKDEDEAYIA